MADGKSQGSLVNGATLTVTILILGCFLVLLYKVFEKPSSPTGQPIATGIADPVMQPAPVIRSSASGSNALASRGEAPASEVTTPPAATVGTSTSALAPSPMSSAPSSGAVRVAGSEASVVALPPLVRYDAQPAGSEMRIDGTATGKSWATVGRLIAGDFEVEPGWQTDPSLKSVRCLGAGQTPPRCEASIPIRSLKSQVPVGGAIMDQRMQREMNAGQFPKIEYRLTEMVIQGEVPASGSPVTFETKGRLAIAGVTNEVSFPVTMERVGQNGLKFTGKYATKMTAFGIKPPEFELLGIRLRTGDAVTLTWTWRVALSAPRAAQQLGTGENAKAP